MSFPLCSGWSRNGVADVLRKPGVAGLLTFHGTIAGQYAGYEPMGAGEGRI